MKDLVYSEEDVDTLNSMIGESDQEEEDILEVTNVGTLQDAKKYSKVVT
jgi:hypothetical protein